MLTIAYLANQFPSPVEPYVSQEIEELRRRGVIVVAGTVRRALRAPEYKKEPEVVLLPFSPIAVAGGIWLCFCRRKRIFPLLRRVLLDGQERILLRLKALVQTLLGACYAAKLQKLGIAHIHVHHGYGASWIALTASRLLAVDFSMMLHGSDLLVNGPYLDTKLKYCSFCLTVSDYNRSYILRRYPQIPANKVLVSRLGVEVRSEPYFCHDNSDGLLTILSVGRLHPVKDHKFLICACRELSMDGTDFRCFIVGDGPERRRLQALIQKYGLDRRVFLLGHLHREEISTWYDRADVVVLTSRSEGIPLVLMEAMACGKLVLAPAITGIPELVEHGRTGFLYETGSMRDFVTQLHWLHGMMEAERRIEGGGSSGNWCMQNTPLGRVRLAARAQVQQKFNRDTNLANFAALFLKKTTAAQETTPDENSVLQQV